MNSSAPVTLLIATRNAHKVSEIRAILGDWFGYLTLNDFPGAPAVVEDAATFAGNATKKALELAAWLSSTRNAEPRARNLFVLADDSGLEVDALNGAPGVYSARFAALDSGGDGNSPDCENNAKLLRLLKNIPTEKRTARFRCVLALTPASSAGRRSSVGGGHGESRTLDAPASPVCFADEAELQTEIFEGACEGRIDFSAHGKNGFGYDPLFIPNGFEQSFAELGDEIKNRLSHRSKALAKLQGRLKI
jgi:XTP/dITP diphosphohydrolase